MSEKERKLKNMMRLFLNGIRDYERESGSPICYDERDSEEFVQIFIDSEDAFDYHAILKEQNHDFELKSDHWKKYSYNHGGFRNKTAHAKLQ